MPTNFETAIENAAALLTRRENGLIRTYGSPGEEAITISQGWVEIAKAISENERRQPE